MSALELAISSYSFVSPNSELLVWALLAQCSSNELEGYSHAVSFGETWTAPKPISLAVLLFFLIGIPCLLDASLHLPPSSLHISNLERTEYLTFMLYIPGPSSAWKPAQPQHPHSPLTETWCCPHIVAQPLGKVHVYPSFDPGPEIVACSALESISLCHVF